VPGPPEAEPFTVDADGHVLEPRGTWLDYLEPAWRDRAVLGLNAARFYGLELPGRTAGGTDRSARARSAPG
jgi:hypothetical protein